MASPTSAARPGSACSPRWAPAFASACSTAGYARYPKVNDIAVGIAMMQFGTGIAFFFGKPFIQPSRRIYPLFRSAAGSDIPQLRAALDVNVLFLVGIVLALGLSWAFRNTAGRPHRPHRRRQAPSGARDGRSVEHGAAACDGRGRRPCGDRRRLPLALLSWRLERSAFRRARV